MNKTTISILLIFIFSVTYSNAISYNKSISKNRFTASVSLLVDARIEHTMLPRISQATGIADISGTVLSNAEIKEIGINYYTDNQLNFSTATYIVQSNLTTQNFSFNIKVDTSSGAGFFKYRLYAIDSANRKLQLPQNGSFYFVDIMSPQISHTPIERISSITKKVVISGQVSDNKNLNTIWLYHKTDIDADYTSDKIELTTSTLTSFNFNFNYTINNLDAKTFYYYLKASDLSGNISFLLNNGQAFRTVITSSVTARVGYSGGIYRMPNGNPSAGETYIDIPPGCIEPGTEITITEIDPNDTAIMPASFMVSSILHGSNIKGYVKPIAAYKLGPDGLRFSKLITLNLLYQAKDGYVEGTQYKIDSLKIMWWDGYEWRLIGGTANSNTVSAKIAQFGLYAIFPVPVLNDSDYRPKEHIITPACLDGKNDIAIFSGLVDGDIVNIFDVNGKLIRQIKDTYIWNGKDDDNNIVESGIYIYQIKTAGKIISGTIAVAK